MKKDYNVEVYEKEDEEDFNESLSKPNGDKVKAFNQALGIAKKIGKNVVYGYTTRKYPNKFFEVDPHEYDGDDNKFRKQYGANTIYVAYPDSTFVEEDDTIEESCGKSIKKSFKKVKEDKTSELDRIDAKRDNRVEKAKARLKKVIDDADAQRDDKKKEIKEGLSYGELTTIADEWEKFKEKVGRNDADTALEFIDTECAGVYDSDDEKEEIFSYIGTLEESFDPNKCSSKNKKVDESVEKIELETDKEKIRIETEKKEEGESKDETIVPASEETIDEIKSDDVSLEDIDEVDEEQIDELGESYLKRVYENVDSFKANSCKLENGKLIVEGVIGFKSGKTRETSFMFESVCKTKTGKVKILGENKGISNCKRAFTFTGKVDGSKFIAESLTYKYNAKENKDGNAKRIYGRVLVGKK